MNTRKKFKFRNQFKSLHFYSMPTSILFIVRKRLNFVFFFIALLLVFFYTII